MMARGIRIIVKNKNPAMTIRNSPATNKPTPNKNPNNEPSLYEGLEIIFRFLGKLSVFEPKKGIKGTLIPFIGSPIF